VPGSIVNLRILKARTRYFEAQIVDTVKKSPLEQDLPAHYQVYGGCKWLPIAYPEQLRIKEEQVSEAFHSIKKYWDSSKSQETEDLLDIELAGELPSVYESPVIILREPPVFHPIVPSPEIFGYRNKVEFSWGKYISEKESIRDEFRFGFHAQGQFDRIIDCDFCVLADDEINAIFKEMNTYSRSSGLPTYDPKTNAGFWRHFVVRKAHFTEEIMLILSVNHEFEGYDRKHESSIIGFVGKLVEEYPHITSVYLLENSGRADIVTGNAILMKGKSTITEKLL
jgi:23S rRNA (uracil1939-C5)-methyltransferase